MKRALSVLPFLLAALVVFAAFSPLLRAPFLFDDHTVIEGDGAMVAATMRDDGNERAVDLWKDLWRKPRPLRQLSHRIEWRLVGDSPAMPHTTNILLHLAVAAAGWWLLRKRCGASPQTAAIAAALFLVNPVVVESVGIVSNRKEMLSALFVLLSLAAALKTPGRFSWAAAACLLLAAAGKETALVAPALFALLAFRSSEEGRGGASSDRSRAWLRPFVLYYVVAALGAAFFWWQIREGMDFAGGNPGDVEVRAGHFTAGVAWGEAISAAVRGFPRHLLLLALPFGHAPDPVIGLHVPLLSLETAAAVLAIVFGAAILALLATWRDPALRPALWILAALAPYLFPGFLRMGATAVLADRYLYLASFGFAWLAAMLVERLPRRASVAVAAVVVAVYADMSFRLCRPYRDEAEYWAFAARENPTSVLAAHNHAWALWKKHEDFVGARREVRRMLRLAPDFDYGLCSFAQMNAEEDDPESAFELLESALRRRPESMLLHRQRALVGGIFDDDDAVTLAHFRKAARLGAKDPAFHLGFAELLQRMLEWPAAAREFELAGRDPAFAEEARGAWLMLHNPKSDSTSSGVLVLGDSVPHGKGTDAAGAEDDAAGGRLSLAAALQSLLPPGDVRKAVDASVPGSAVEDLFEQLNNHLEPDDESEETHVPAVCVLFTGHNDAFAGASSYEILQQLADAALDCRREGIIPVIVGPISVRDEPGKPRQRQEKVLAALDRKLASFCSTAQFYYVSSRSVLGVNDPAASSGANYDSATGDHLSREGIERLARVIQPFAFPAP